MILHLGLGIWCSECIKYHDMYVDVYLNMVCEGSVTCPEGHLLGFVWDKSWIEIME